MTDKNNLVPESHSLETENPADVGDAPIDDAPKDDAPKDDAPKDDAPKDDVSNEELDPSTAPAAESSGKAEAVDSENSEAEAVDSESSDSESSDSESSEAAAEEAEPAVDFDDLEDEFDDDFVDEDEDENEDAAPLESLVEEGATSDDIEMSWYILKVQVNRETSICDALRRRVSVAGLDHFFSDILVPTEDVREFNKNGKQRIVKRKLYPGYVVVQMAINDESWFLVRETSGIGDFTGAAGKPAPLTEDEIDRILKTTLPSEKEKTEENVKIGIKYKVGDRVRVKEGNFQNYEGDVSNIDERNGRVTVLINIFNRPNPVELDHWQVEEFE